MEKEDEKMMFKLWQKITAKIRFRMYVRVHKNAVSHPSSMLTFSEYIKRCTNIVPKNIFEIGANYAQDAEGLRYYFNLKDSDVWVFEAHPQICDEIKKMYKFNCFNKAVFNKKESMIFNAVDIKKAKHKYEIGMSSLLENSSIDDRTIRINVEAIRMDDFMKENNIAFIDFLKIDVEGANYEVLEGFGERIRDIKSLHIEAEHKPIWNNQKLYSDISDLLSKNNFEQVYYCKSYSQSDSFWVKKEYLKEKP
jgi:FkbM family methyltransferase